MATKGQGEEREKQAGKLRSVETVETRPERPENAQK